MYNIIIGKIIFGRRENMTKERTRASDAPVSTLSGVGPARAAAYRSMGISTLSDLVRHYPRAYENRGDIKLLFEAMQCEGKSAVVLTVATEPRVANIRRGMSLLKFRAYDESGTAEITFFNQNFLKDKFPLGATFRFYGKVEMVGRKCAISSPSYEPYDEERPPADLIPIYRMTEGITPKQIASNVSTALDICLDETEDFLPETTAARYSLCSLRYALKNIHQPSDYEALTAAKRRLIFDEFFTFALGLALSKEKSRPALAPPCRDTELREFLSALPYTLTQAQQRAVSEICADMRGNIPMNRMLVGDVGCGKTVCAAAAMYVAIKNGRQAVLMAPTEILARQHYADFCELFGKLGIECGLLIGATGAAQKRKIKERLCESDPAKRLNLVVGTQALLSEGVEFSAPGLVVTDEQHRFGVNQRATLAGKNVNAHLLVMSATPIPRSMALIMYGDLDVSKIDGMPPGRQRVDTFAVDESYRPRLEVFIEKQIELGGQVYIVCPAVEEKEEEEGDLLLSDVTLRRGAPDADATPLKTAVEYAAALSERFPQYRVEFIHGKLISAEKERVMSEFAEGRVQILVSTTVIEVGVNVPNACLMMVENADRFGLSQLHQLRGRVGRGTRKSYCVLVSDFASDNKKESVAGRRLRSLCKLYDGYEIAEQDLLMRGPGDFFRMGSDDTIRQSGGIRMSLAESCDDSSLMSSAFAEAAALISADPTLEYHRGLASAIERLFELEAGTMN